MINPYKLEFISKNDINGIYQASLDILEDVGVAFYHDEALKLLDRNGAKVDFKKRTVYLQEDLIKDLIRKAPSSFTIYSQNTEKKVEYSEGQTHFTIGADYAGYILDFESEKRRKATLEDVQNFIIVDDALDSNEINGPCVMPSDVPYEMVQIKFAETMFKLSSKPCSVFMANMNDIKYIFRMAELLAGGKESLSKRPIFSILSQPVAPLRYSKECVDKIYEGARSGIPLGIAPAPSCGLTAPVTIAGFVAQGFAEALAGVSFAQLVKEKTPVSVSLASIIMNFRDGSLNIGSPEAILSHVAFVQLAHNLGLIANGGGGTDSKLPTIQIGYEKAFSILLNVLVGAEGIHIASLDDWGTTAMEQHVIDDEIIKYAKRLLQGFNVSAETLAIDVIKDVGIGGNFLEHKHTFRNFKKEHWIPELSFRESWQTLEKSDRKTIVENAKRKVAEILRDHRPEPLEKDIQRSIKTIVREAEKELMR